MFKATARSFRPLFLFLIGVGGLPFIAEPMVVRQFVFQLGTLVRVIAPISKHRLRFDDRRSVFVLADGRTLFLNKESGSVDVFSANSVYQYSIGPRSQGRRVIPPRAIAVTTSGVLAALELTGQAVSLYQLHQTGASLFKTIEMIGVPTSICALDNRFLIHINESNRSIYSLSDGGHLRKAFELGMPPGVPGLASYYFNADLTCLTQQNAFLAYSRSFPMISAYSVVDGKKLWANSIPGFTPLPLHERADGGLEVPVDKTSYDQTVALFPLDDKVVVLQFRSIHNMGDGENPSNAPHSRFLSTSSGAEIGRSDSLPLFTTAARAMVYSYDSRSGSVLAYKYDVRQR